MPIIHVTTAQATIWGWVGVSSSFSSPRRIPLLLLRPERIHSKPVLKLHKEGRPSRVLALGRLKMTAPITIDISRSGESLCVYRVSMKAARRGADSPAVLALPPPAAPSSPMSFALAVCHCCLNSKKEENDVLISLCVYSIAKRSFAMVYTPLRVLPYISGVAAYSPPMPPAHGSACHFFIARLSLTDNLFARISRP